MYAIIQPFLLIALLRRPPQELPQSRLLLRLVLAVHLLLGILLYLFQYRFLTALLTAATGTLMLCALTFSLLIISGNRQRLVKTLCALGGPDIIVGVISIPVLTLAPAGASSLFYVLIMAWNLAVAAHILRHALSVSAIQGFVYAMIFFMLTITVLQVLIRAIN